MKNTIVIMALLAFSFSSAQVFIGEGDTKFQVGANIQDKATGINVTYDYGLGQNFSIGLSSAYALGIEDGLNADFTDRFDLKGRFNANLGNVLNIDENLDVYPGLNLSLKNFGGHIGLRYFFSEGFGVYSEAVFPLAKYSTNLTPAETLHNQFTFNIGASFNL